jgi:DNA polymerase I
VAKFDSLSFHEVWAVDFEFIAGAGERPVPICLVAQELRTDRLLRLWHHEFGDRPPYPIDDNTLFVAYYASAELGCHRALGWPAPVRILDLFTEFRALTNGLAVPAGNGLIGALIACGLDHLSVTEKEEMRALVVRGGPWTAEEQTAVLDYCETDINALRRLLLVMVDRIDLPRALLRGRYMAAAAAMEHYGVPIDTAALERLRTNWEFIKVRLIERIDADYNVFDGSTFKVAGFEIWLNRNGIPWPRLPTGRLDLADDTFRQMSKAYPAVAPLRELRSALSELRLDGLTVGCDGRNRCLLSPFRARSGRNQPSNSKFIFGPSVWLRGLIKPPEGYGVAYVDWEQQEFGIAAALSGDQAMQAAYRSGDPYLAFAKQAGAASEGATKETHSEIRELFKACALGVQYGMGAETLATRLGRPPCLARDLLRLHCNTYPTFWRWSDAAIDNAILSRSLPTVFGWRVHVGPDTNPRSLRNFPMQGNGSEMLRLACCLATEDGLEVCAPVHDAVLIAAPLDRLEADVARMRAAMAEASRVVLADFELRTEAKIIRWPERYMDPRGERMWNAVWSLIEEIEAVDVAAE